MPESWVCATLTHEGGVRMTNVRVVAAVVLMVTGAVLLLTGSSSVLPYAAITVGIALTVVVGRRNRPAH